MEDENEGQKSKKRDWVLTISRGTSLEMSVWRFFLARREVRKRLPRTTPYLESVWSLAAAALPQKVLCRRSTTAAPLYGSTSVSCQAD